jgi:hypothetical protein
MAKRVTLRQYSMIAEDHNKQNRDDNYTWEDIIYNEVLCGNNIEGDFDKMSKKELLIIIDWAVACMPHFDGVDRTYQTIYKTAMSSLRKKL